MAQNSDQEIRTQLAELAAASGFNSDAVARMFGVGDAPNETFGQRAQEKLDHFLRDPDWWARVERGETVATDQYHALTVAIAWQQGQDRAAQLQASKDGIAKQEAELAAAEKAAVEGAGQVQS